MICHLLGSPSSSTMFLLLLLPLLLLLLFLLWLLVLLFSIVDNFYSNHLVLWFCKGIYELRKENYSQIQLCLVRSFLSSKLCQEAICTWYPYIERVDSKVTYVASTIAMRHRWAILLPYIKKVTITTAICLFEILEHIQVTK